MWPKSKKAPQRPLGRKVRLAASRLKKGETKGAITTKKIILEAFDASMGHSGDLEGALGHLVHFGLRGREKVEIN